MLSTLNSCQSGLGDGIIDDADTSLRPGTDESINPTTEEQTWIRYFGGMIRCLFVVCVGWGVTL